MGEHLDLELAALWQDGRTRFRDRRFFAAVDPAAARVGDVGITALLERDDGMPLDLPCDPLPGVATPREAWPLQLGGQRLEPRPGRWYPRLVLAGRPGFASGDRTPMRVTAADAGTVTVDLNPPLAGRSLTVEARAFSAVGATPPASPHDDLLPLLLGNGPGMQAALGDAYPAPQNEDLARADEAPDADFYLGPRLVDHLDRTALLQMRLLHRRFLAPGMRALDLMASCNSHLDEVAGLEVCGLGMNAEELSRNPYLAERLVHDLNARPDLPFRNAAFDFAYCALSVEYLVHPRQLFAEVARVLKPGGTFLVSFSERWFPPKAIRVWSELHPFERIGLVLGYFADSARFADLHAESLRGLPRPPDDKYYRMTRLSDPLYAVWGTARP